VRRERRNAMSTDHGQHDPEVISDEEWSEQSGGAGLSGSAGPDADDPQGMRGQLDDSMDGLEADDDLSEASRGIPQNADTASETDAASETGAASDDGDSS
jgi:hypothetical protein